MTDLFSVLPQRWQPDQSIGRDTAQFLGRLANGETRARLLERHKAGEWPDLNLQIARDNLAFKGMNV